jgi:hypothetical protein
VLQAEVLPQHSEDEVPHTLRKPSFVHDTHTHTHTISHTHTYIHTHTTHKHIGAPHVQIRRQKRLLSLQGKRHDTYMYTNTYTPGVLF